MSNVPLIIVDGSYHLHRFYYAMPNFTNIRGEPTWAIYGVLNLLKKILIKYKPKYMVVVFDYQKRTFRNFLYKEYKSHRLKMPEDLLVQIKPLYEMIKAMGIPLISVPDVEGDDVIGTLAVFAERLGKDVMISTYDKDMAQLVSDKINLVDISSSVVLDPQSVKLKFGVSPKSIVDYLSLVGDPTDNIPGVPHIGKKIACILLDIFGSLQKLYQNVDTVSSLKFRGSKNIEVILKDNKEMAFISYQLASIKTNVILDINNYHQLSLDTPDIQKLLILFRDYGFNRWLKDIQNNKWLEGCLNVISYCDIDRYPLLPYYNKSAESYYFENKHELGFMPFVNRKREYEIIYNMQMFNKWIDKIYSSKIFAFDIQVDNNDVLVSSLIGMSISVKLGEAVILPISPLFENLFVNISYQLNYVEILTTLKSIFENTNICKISKDLKIICGVFNRYSINLSVNVIFDIEVELYLLYNAHNFIDVLINDLDRDLVNAIIFFREKNNEKKYKIFISHLSLTEEDIFNICEKVEIMLFLHQKLWFKILQEPSLKKIFESVEMPLVAVLSRVENFGVLIDKNILNSYSSELSNRICALELQAHKLANESFNLNSTKQLRNILFCKQKIPVLKKTPSGFPSTSEEVLRELSVNYSIPKVILEYRNLVRLKSAYTDKLPLMIHKNSNRIHTSYHQTLTLTGRLSSSSPNLQNIPVKNVAGQRIRKAFIVPDNYLIVSVDYSQIESRIMAHLSNDRELSSIFLLGKDIHCVTASEIFAIPLEKVSKEQRRWAKIVNFSLMYGIGTFSLARRLSLSYYKAQHYISAYFKRYCGIKSYMEFVIKEVMIYGYVVTMEGRKIYIPNIFSKNYKHKKNAERMAINAVIQGTAADIIKRSMVIVDNWLRMENLLAHIIMQVHDELIFEVHCDIIDYFIICIKDLMESCVKLNIPLKVKISVGNNWGSMF